MKVTRQSSVIVGCCNACMDSTPHEVLRIDLGQFWFRLCERCAQRLAQRLARHFTPPANRSLSAND